MRWIPAAAGLLIVLLLILLLWTRVGVWAALDREGTFRLDVRFGVFRFHVLPAGPKKTRAEKTPQKEKLPKKEKPEKKKAAFSFAWEDLEDALRTVLPALGRSLGRLGRGIRIKPLRLSLTLPGLEDPAAAAAAYGRIQAAVWGGMPLAERLVDIREPYFQAGVDFLGEDLSLEGEAGVTLRIGTLLAMGFGVAFPALGWFLRWRKRCKTRPPKLEKRREPSGPESPAA